ncbi:MAG TPA: SEC-C metal-binding domain-containing protein [Chlamydiales bacterium]|nr:SEC-C metal-binding domain-containing protein [Chlamydiales bacterium]
MKKTGRNDPCPCGSGKKFKKCCESIMLGGRFKAEKVDIASAAAIQKTVGLTSLFHARLAETPKKPLPPPEVIPQ